MKQLIQLILLCAFTYNVSAQKINLVKDINPGNGDSKPKIMAVMSDGTVLFRADDGTNGYELWKTDGTEQGTTMVKQIHSGNTSGVGIDNSLFVNNKLYFYGHSANEGYELWVSDGTTLGTKMIKDIYPGSESGVYASTFSRIIYFNNKIYFAGRTAAHGTELWSTDGTEQGTKMVKDIYIGSNSSTPRHFNIVNGRMIFTASSLNTGIEMWSTDGTTQGTKIIDDYYSGSSNGAPTDHGTVIAYKNKVYFSGRKNNLTGWELCSTDGNTISLVKDIRSSFTNSSHPGNFREVNGELFFTAQDDNTGGELWKTNGASQGTVQVKDIRPGNTGSTLKPMGDINNKLLLRANDGTHGSELWISDGTTQGTKLLIDINTGSNMGVELTKSDYLNIENRLPVKNSYNNIFYFAGDDGTNGIELWRTDGTDTGTYIVEEVGLQPNNTASSELEYIYIDSNNVWLAMSDGAKGIELYLYKAPIPVTPPPSSIGNTQTQKAKIYPNPSNGNFIINMKSTSFLNGIVRIYDIAGREIYNQSIEHSQSQISISLSQVPAGTYQVVLELDRRVETHKISIQH